MASFLGQLFAEAPSQNSRPPTMSQAELNARWAAASGQGPAQGSEDARLDMSGAMAAPPAYPNAREAALAMLAGSEFREERLAQAQRVEDFEARQSEALAARAKGGYRKHTRSRKHKGSRKHKNTRKHKGSRKHKRARRA